MPAAHWTHHDILQAIQLKGWTQERIAKELDMSPSGVSYAVRAGSNLRLRRFIAELICVEERELWPNRYPSPWREGDLPT